MNCLIAASCRAGMCLRPPLKQSGSSQKKLIQHKAKIGSPIALILDEMAFNFSSHITNLVV
jgi:hypothetical protein